MTSDYTQTDQLFNPVLSFNVGTLTAADVGKTAFIVSLPGEQKAAGGRCTSTAATPKAASSRSTSRP